jgi:hypothetical protein
MSASLTRFTSDVSDGSPKSVYGEVMMMMGRRM